MSTDSAEVGEDTFRYASYPRGGDIQQHWNPNAPNAITRRPIQEGTDYQTEGVRTGQVRHGAESVDLTPRSALHSSIKPTCRSRGRLRAVWLNRSDCLPKLKSCVGAWGGVGVAAWRAFPPLSIGHNLGTTESTSGYFGVSGGRNGPRSASYCRTSEQYITRRNRWCCA